MQDLDFRRKRKRSNNRKPAKPRRTRRTSSRGGLRFEDGKAPLHFAQEKLRRSRVGAKDIVIWAVELLLVCMLAVFLVAAFGQIIPKAILEMKKYGCINVHASLLPRYRGAAPIQWAVINGEKESGVTIMQMDEGLDTGDMLLKETVPLEEKETGGSLFDKLSRVGADLCVKALKELEKGTIVSEKQGESPTAYASMLTKEMGKICIAKNPNFPIPNLDFDFLPVGIDIRKVVETGITPEIHGGMFNREGGLIGAGSARVPMECFEKALQAYEKKYGGNV